ncbi:MAG: hypothetical protein AUH42_00750 [Gemmatimonadetes bacterium 13_1_40CM_70_11]|nr:MAG: hypothetical protein AUH42_00750 [Gemmatimonadetes bacterium 13_1_40CM_70_11]
MPSVVDVKRVYVAVAACAVVVYLGALWNRFAMDDLYVIAFNPLVHSASGIWRSFGAPYWPPDYGGKMYRPLVMATFGLDRLVDGPAWFHAVNVFWHAAAAVVVAVLARHWAGLRGALVAGVIFAVHPVHVEAVANVVGRAELMAALFTMLAVYAALERESIAWSTFALAFGLLGKENAAVAPGLIAWAWMLGLRRPAPRRIVAYAASWAALAAVYGLIRWHVLHAYAHWDVVAPIFLGATGLQVRLTAVAALADIVRLLVFPLTLRVDYSPNEYTLVSSPLDSRFLLGVAALLLWAGLLWWAWRRDRKLEALGLGWIAIAFLPVANLLFPTGILLAERTLYLPSAGLALALGGWLHEAAAGTNRFHLALWAVCLAAGVRSATRVPVWRDDKAVTLSIFDDSPASYRGPARTAGLFQSAGQAAKALAAYQAAARIYDRDPTVFVGAADAAFSLGRPTLADALLIRVDQLCFRCTGYLHVQAVAARSRGDSATAGWLEVRARDWERQ